MSIHHLNFFLNEGLYIIPEEKNQLILTAETKLESEEPTGEEESIGSDEVLELTYEGGFEKGVLVTYEGNELTHEHQELLFKILGAVGCSLKDIALTSSLVIEEVPMSSILAMNPNKIIVFGNIHHDILSRRKKLYEVLQEDDIEYLFADDLAQISTQVNLKKSLWSELQVLFNITKK